MVILVPPLNCALYLLLVNVPVQRCIHACLWQPAHSHPLKGETKQKKTQSYVKL